uniref:Uncharacterized protein n=1 Tax=Strongyloides stercoralis TaxID=6248 RepID=A0A0K0DSI3_STRER
MRYFSNSEEDNTTNGSSFERQNVCLPASQNFSVAIDVPTDNYSDEPVENDLYRNLMKWLRRNYLEELNSFRLALLESIKNVSADSAIIKSESQILIKNINSFDCKVAIEGINYTALSLTRDSGKNQILSFLLALKQNLNLNKFKSSTEYDG